MKYVWEGKYRISSVAKRVVAETLSEAADRLKCLADVFDYHGDELQSVTCLMEVNE